MTATLLQGKVAVVTGAARGLGLSIAAAFARHGASVVLVGRDATALQSAVTLIQHNGGVATAVVLDITSPHAANNVITAAVAAFGHVDILVNSAGAFVMQSLVDITPDEWQRTLDTNLTAPFLLIQAFVRHQLAAGLKGGVINIGSVHGLVGDAQAVPQCASKYGVVGLTRAAAEACREYGIRVNAISPGAIEAESADRTTHQLGSQVTQGDVAQLAVYLASDLANAVTGAIVDVFGVTRPVIANG